MSNGGQRGPEKIGDVVGRLFAAKGWGRRSERLMLESAWADAAGAKVAAKSRVLALKRGVLEVEVAAGALLQELAAFHKRPLLEAMRRALPGMVVKEIRFRAGAG